MRQALPLEVHTAHRSLPMGSLFEPQNGLAHQVCIFLIGLFLGLGRYRVGAAIGSGVSAQGREPSQAEILKNDERSERGSGPAAA